MIAIVTYSFVREEVEGEPEAVRAQRELEGVGSGGQDASSVPIAEVEKSIEKPISSDVEESNESATETPSVGGSGGKESLNSESSSAGGGLGGDP